jgi:AraC-like DNA-binding protein/cell division protein FtsB
MRKYIQAEAYLHVFLILVILFSAAVIPFSFYLSNQYSDYASQELERNDRYKLEQTKENLLFTFDRLKRVTLSLYEEPEIRTWIQLREEDPFALNAMVQLLKKRLVNEPYIESVILYNTNLGRAFDYQTGMLPANEIMQEAMERLVQGDSPNYFRITKLLFQGREGLAISLPFGLEKNSPRSFLVIRLNDDAIQKSMLQLNKDSGVFIHVADGNGDSIIGQSDEALHNQLREQGKLQHKETFRTSVQGSKWIVSYDLAGIEDWTIYYSARMDDWFRNVESFKHKILYSFLGLLLLLIAILFWNARKYHRPVSLLARQVSSMFEMAAEGGWRRRLLPKAEVHQIQQGFGILSEKIEQLNQSVQDGRLRLKEDDLREWVNEGRLEDAARKRLQEVSTILDYPYIVLAVCRIDSYMALSEKHDFSSRKTLKSMIVNIASESVAAHKAWKVESVDFGGNHLVFLVGVHAEDEMKDLRFYFEEINDSVQKWLKLNLTVGLSDLHQPDCNLKLVYDKAFQLATLSFIDGNSRIYQETDYEHEATSLVSLTDEAIPPGLIDSIRLGQTDKAMRLLDEAGSRLRQMSYDECKLQLTFLIYHLYKAFGKVMNSSGMNGIRSELDRFNTLDEAMEKLKGETEAIIASLYERRAGERRDERVEEMIHYLKVNIHNPMLTIDEMANHVSLSVNYARTLFKERTGITVAGYILNERIQLVKYLLVQTDKTIAEIAAESGFQSRSTFFTVFKKEVGVTPSDYRSNLRGAVRNG